MTIISAIILLGILIFIHELGHFIFAKLMKVKVLKFALGFGPKLIGKKLGETEYLIAALPLGGYVKMLGEEPGEELSEDDKDRSFQNQSLPKRAIIVFAGAFFNVVLAYVIYTSVLAFQIPIQIPVIKKVLPVISEVVPGSPADVAGVLSGDKVIKIDDKKIQFRAQIEEIVAESPGIPLQFAIERGEELLELVVTPLEINIGLNQKIGQAGIEANNSNIIDVVTADSIAYNAGLRNGDRIIKIDDIDINTWNEMVGVIRDNPGVNIDITVKRGEDVINTEATPEAVEVEFKGGKSFIGMLGIRKKSEHIIVKSDSITGALYDGLFVTYKYGLVIYESIGLLFSGEVSFKDNAGGPITIVMESGRMASLGVLPYLLFMALISVNLGVLNLLPVPVLDGGHLMFMIIERIKGRPLSERTMVIATKIGLALLLALMLAVTYNDIVRYFIPR